MSPPSGTVELNRTSSVNLTCHVTGQPVAHVEWYRNRQRILPSPLIRRIQYGNGSIESVLTLKKVKYRDRGTIISCSAWYPTLPINSTRNVLLLVHGKHVEDLSALSTYHPIHPLTFWFACLITIVLINCTDGQKVERIINVGGGGGGGGVVIGEPRERSIPLREL